VYLLLLPLGGYRDYRAYIVRYDTLQPITLGLFAFAVGTAVHLLNELSVNTQRIRYAAGVILMALIYANADKRLVLPMAVNNAPERAALAELAASSGTEHVLPEVSVISWGRFGHLRIPITMHACSTTGV
jgi:hypothetical protein